MTFIPNAQQIQALFNYKIVLAREDFLTYRQLLNPSLKINWFVKELSKNLEQFVLDYEHDLNPRLIIQAPPQHGKSEAITDIVTWFAGRNPNAKKIFASFSQRLGIRANLKLQRTYSRKIYNQIFPNTKINSRNVVTGVSYLRNREILEYVNKNGYFRNTTVQGSITGESLDLGIIDDPIKGREEANSQTIRDKTWSWFTDDFFTRFSENAGFLMILTRWHDDDPAGRLIKNYDKIKLLTYQAIAEDDEEHRKAGEPLFPEHKSIDFLNERKKLLGSNFQALYQQNPIIQGGNLFKKDWIKYINSDIINSIKFDKYYITADSALKSKEHNDYTVYSAFGVAENKLYLLDMYRGKPESKERELTLKAFYNRNNKYPFHGCYIEQKASGIDLFQRLKQDGFIVKEVERNTDKLLRANNAMPYLETHNLHINENLPHLNELLSEFEQFPNSKHDDIIDTIIDGVEICYMNNTQDWAKLAENLKKLYK